MSNQKTLVSMRLHADIIKDIENACKRWNISQAEYVACLVSAHKAGWDEDTLELYLDLAYKL